jgi:hypothetical protein
MLPLPPPPLFRVPCFGRSWTIWKHKEGRPSKRPHYRHFWMSQILPVWQGETPTAARLCNPRAAETVETPAATLSRVLDPINRCSPTTKSAKNARRGNCERTALTRKVIAPVCPSASVSLGSLRPLWLSCSGSEIFASWHLCAIALMQLPSRAWRGESRMADKMPGRAAQTASIQYAGGDLSRLANPQARLSARAGPARFAPLPSPLRIAASTSQSEAHPRQEAAADHSPPLLCKFVELAFE